VGVVIHGDASLPIYVQLETLIREKIEHGEWAPGLMLPSERRLCEEYGIARMTVRQAISNLVSEGLLTRTQGRGTFVARPPLRQSLSKLTSFTEDMRDRGLLATTRLLAKDVFAAGPELTAQLGAPAGVMVLQLQRLRSANGIPIALETCTLRCDIAEPLMHEDFERQSLYRLLEVRCGVRLVRASQELEAGIANEAEGRMLGVSVGAPVLRIQRRSLGLWQGQEELFEYVRSVYRGDRYRFHVELER
jgi:GntR family transcriptional regulator